MANSILVVHTSDKVHSFFSDYFKEEDCTISHEKDGVHALKKIIDNKPNLILMGVAIPVMNYQDILRIIKGGQTDSFVCLIGDEGKNKIPVLNSGADAFIEQPLQIDAVKETIDKLLLKQKIRRRSLAKTQKFYNSKTYLIHLLEQITIAIISVDNNGRILSFNQKAEKLWGYQSNFAIGRHFDILCIRENRDKCACVFIEETRRNNSYEGILLFERADGTKFAGELQTSVIKGDSGNEGIVVVIRDLTKQRILEEKLLEKEKLATLGAVVEGVAHEVRNPLITIGGFARRILKKVSSDFPYIHYLKVIIEDVSRLESMVKNIESYVHFAKLHRANFKKGRIEKIVETAVNLIDKKLLNHIDMNFEFDPAVPQMYLDVGYLVETFFNIIENAVESMPNGGAVTIKTSRDDYNYCVVKIIDTGRGVPKDHVDDIFNLFYTTKPSGIGLGLAKAHIIIDEHNGRISINSTRGHGTTVTVTLPLERRQIIRR